MLRKTFPDLKPVKVVYEDAPSYIDAIRASHQAAVLVQAIDGAAEKLKKLLDRNLRRLSSQQRTARPAGETSNLDE